MSDWTVPHADTIATADAAIDAAFKAIIALRTAHTALVDGMLATRNAAAESVATGTDVEEIRSDVHEVYRLAHRIVNLGGALQTAHRQVAQQGELACRLAKEVQANAERDCPALRWG
jgi:hypothetical protein